jgi:hypothetical protein
MITAAASSRRNAAPDLLRQGLRIIWDEQLSHGEIPNYQCMADESWQYCFSPLISTYIYDELSCFDPLSGRFEPQAVERSEKARRLPFLRSVAHIRRRIRRFLAWQESSTGGWRFFGQGSGLQPDVDLTACAATVFIDPNTSPLSPATDRRLRDLERFRVVDGTFQSPGSRGEARPDPVLLWMANCNVLRYLALAGGDTPALEAAILNALVSGAVALDDALLLQYAAARAWRHGRLNSLSTLASSLLPLTLQQQLSSKAPLSAALAVLALLDLGAPKEEIDQAVSRLLNWWDSPLSQKVEPFCGSRCGSPALTAALTMAAVARSGTAWGPAL